MVQVEDTGRDKTCTVLCHGLEEEGIITLSSRWERKKTTVQGTEKEPDRNCEGGGGGGR